MSQDTDIREQGYQYFIREAPELLQVLEQELLSLGEERTLVKVHSLMRTTHTLKGSAANVGLETIKTIAHHLEDVFKALYNPDVEIDAELEALLLQGYECLRLPLIAEITGGYVNETEVMDRTVSVFAQLQEKLGDYFARETPIPTSVELGFDITLSIFEVGVKQRLETLAEVLLTNSDPMQVASALQEQAEIFIGLAESLNLPGFGAIAQTTLDALAAHPQQAHTVLEIALTDFQAGWKAVIEGDRTQGGEPSLALQQLTGTIIPTQDENGEIEEFLIEDDGWEIEAASSDSESDAAVEIEIPVAFSEEILELSDNLEELKIEEDGWQIEEVLTDYDEDFEISEPEDFNLDILDGTIETNPSKNPSEESENLQVLQNQSEEELHNGNLKSEIPELELSDLLDKSEVTDEVKTGLALSEKTLDPSLDDVFGSYVTEAEQPSAESASETLQLTDLILEIEDNNQLQVAESKSQSNNSVSVSNLQSEISNLPSQPSAIANPQPPVTKQSSPVKILRQSVRVDLDLLERLSHFAGELLINQNRQANINEQLQAAIAQMQWRLRRHQQTMNQLRDWSDQMLSSQERQGGKLQISDCRLPIENSNFALNLNSAISNFKFNQFDSLELDEYNELHVLLQLALEEMVQLEEATDSTDILARQSSQILEKQRRLLNNVQDDMQEARMLPLGDIFSRFPRLLQQLSISHKKPVELKLRGTEVLVDRALAEKLYDPLLHLLRNAFDHGIEPPEVRAERGKSETGQIEIYAYHQGNQTIIEVRDDGEGINFDRIRQRAVELKLMSVEQAIALSEAAVLDLLFDPGFSTAAKISDLSGRGVGLDVVKNQMEALCGSVIIRSEPQKGTTFLLQFPLSLTMAKLMICEAEGAVYALLSDAIEQIVIPKSDQVQDNNGQKVLHLSRGSHQSIVPVYNMAELLGGKSQISEEIPLDKNQSNLLSTPLLLLRQRFQGGLGERVELVGLEVDQILGEQELVIRPLGKAIAPPSYVYGGSTLADGRLTLVIDGAALVNRLLDQLAGKLQIGDFRSPIENKDSTSNSNLQSKISNLQLKEFSISSSSKILLVVDDSISLRQTLALTLERAGYKVLQAQNGREALQQLQRNRGIQFVICDVEMPAMNGFEFLTYCCQDPELAKIPVAMLTSRTSEKHRRLATELGAVAYFTKPYREDEILSAIANFLKQGVVGRGEAFA
jgi:two-component system, chemotaxis family, sensor histidine kinase and response regulator PixL